MQLRKIVCFGGGILGVSLAAVPVAAHHGWSGQASNEQISLTGKVAEAVNLAGPHATMKVEVDGKVWDITLAPPARTQRAGLEADTLAVGDEVTIVGNRNLDEAKLEVKTVRVTADGKNFDVYPDRVRES
jgi:hypothetical protein